jgi:tripartite-type tricarboxylate transporter receptor subunit TctC
MRAVLALMFAALLSASGAWSQAWTQDAAADHPNRPIRIVVCVPAGGGVDTVTRTVVDGLQKRLGQPVVVEKKAGAAHDQSAALQEDGLRSD